MHAPTAVFDPTVPLGACQLFPHPTEADAMLALVGPDGDATDQTLLQITKVAEPEAGKKLIELAVLLTSVRHPNLVTLREVRVHDGGIYAIAEHLEGVRLSSVLDESRHRRDGDPGVPVAVALRIAVDVLEGLVALHEAFD